MKKKNAHAEEIMVFDAHCDTANVLFDSSFYSIHNFNHFTIDKARIGGLKAQIFALYVNPVYAPYRAIKKALMLYTTLEKNLFSTGEVVKVTSTYEMQSTLKKDKIACWLSLEGGHIIENSIDILKFFYKLGIRCMTITHSKNTDWADSSGEKPRHDGLTKLGREIINKMDELGMVIDVSHSSDKTIEDVLNISSRPIMASHSCARALCNIPRNLPDDLIKEIAKRNGYIGVNFFPGFLKINIYEQVMKNVEKNSEWLRKEIMDKENDPDIINLAEMRMFFKLIKGIDKVDLTAVIDHIVHIIDVGGINCVGLGSDFDGISSTPTDLKDVSYYIALKDRLYDYGFNNNEIRKILGLNLFNFFKNFDK